ncbi:MAG TPA: cobalamin-independent methionine synthase II family protein [Gryllotalpicola sp.]
MQRSTDRILTTHTGSLPRSAELTRLLVARDQGAAYDPTALTAAIDGDLARTVAAQLDAGLDVINDGEVPRVGFSTYVTERISGFGGEGHRKPTLDTIKFPDYAAIGAKQIAEGGEVARVWNPPVAQGELRYDPEAVDARVELDAFAAALAAEPRQPVETFVTAATPGIVSTTLLLDEANPHYRDHEEYVLALAEVLRPEYERIVAAGHVLQLDAPDLAMERVIMYGDESLDVFLDAVSLHVEAINRALVDIPKDRVRLHVCWGNWQGPHQDDVPVAELLDRLYAARVGAFSIPFGNPRHEHEIRDLAAHPLPEGALLIPGVIDVTTNYLEHPELVAWRIEQAAAAVGDPSRVIAGTDCGLATFASYEFVAQDVAWAKLAALAEGARIASERLFG